VCKYILIAIATIALFSPGVLADGIFFGDVIYKDCEPTLGDEVNMQLNSGGTIYTYGVAHLHHPPYYTTGEDTFPPGTYKLWIAPDESSGCVIGDVQIVVHGSQNQRVDLTVRGDTGHPDSGGGE